MKRRGVLATLLLMVVVACSNPANEQPREVTLHPSWAEGYPTIAQMSKNAGAIARVTIQSVNGTEGADGAVYTNFNAKVDQWVATSTTTPDTISIRQLGGVAGNTTFVVDDDPLLKVGDQQLLFLREFKTGSYVIQGGPTGRLTVDGATLRALPGSACAEAFPAAMTKTMSTIRTTLAAGTGKSRLVPQ